MRKVHDKATQVQKWEHFYFITVFPPLTISVSFCFGTNIYFMHKKASSINLYNFFSFSETFLRKVSENIKSYFRELYFELQVVLWG